MTVHRVAALSATAVFVVVVLLGLYLAGSPGEQRLVRLDNRRVTDLCSLSNLVERYWEKHQALPDRLDSGIASTTTRTDPETGLPYEYEITGDGGYRLCARFGLRSNQPETGHFCKQGSDFWRHGAGRHCFAFDVESPNEDSSSARPFFSETPEHAEPISQAWKCNETLQIG